MAVIAEAPTPLASREHIKRERIQKLKITGRAYLWLSLLLISMAVIVFYPLIYGFILSFTNANQANVAIHLGAVTLPATYQFIGFKNYTDIFSSWIVAGSDDQHVLIQTAIWIVANAVFHFLIGLGLALILNRRMRLRGIYRTLLMVPWAMPQFVAAFSWRFLYNQDNGYINTVLQALHLPAIGWGSDPAWALVSVIIVNIWLGIPFMTVALLGGLQSIPGELYEASSIDGASWWQTLRFITLPMLRPIAFLVTLLDVIWTFNVFAVIYLITGGGPFNRSHTLITWAWFRAIQTGLYGSGAAYGFIILLILLIFTLIYSRMLRANEAIY